MGFDLIIRSFGLNVRPYVDSKTGSLIQPKTNKESTPLNMPYDDYEDDGNNWTDLKFNGPNSEEFEDLDTVDDTGSLYSGGVQYTENRIDYAKFTLETAATLCFSVCSSEASVKFAVYRLNESSKNGVVTYSLKTLQSVSTKKSKDEDDDDYYATTKKLLLTAGDYYISVEAVNKKSDEASYDVEIDDEKSVFFNEGDNSDDWENLKEKGPDGDVGEIGTINEDSGLLYDDWVGYGDTFDYKRFTLDNAARTSFYVDATDKVKFTIYKLVDKKDKNGVVTYSLKSLQSASIPKIKGVDEDEEYKYEGTTKGLLLEAGDYYICVESKNAKKGGSAYYDVFFNRDNSTFFVDGDNGWNNWLYDKKQKALNVEYMDQFVVTELNSLTTDVMMDNSATSNDYWNNYVGYGDATDFARIHLDKTAKVSFTLEASDAAKFTIYSLVEGTNKKGVKTISLKALQTTVVKVSKGMSKGVNVTKGLQLDAGDYYISMQATNASKGGTAYYNVTLNKNACSGLPVIEVYDVSDDADEGWNNWLCNRKKGLNPDAVEFIVNALKPGASNVLLDDNPISIAAWDNYVGYGDDTDFAKITLGSAAKLSFTINYTDAVKFIIYSLEEGTDSKGETTYTQNALQTTILKLPKSSDESAGTTEALLLKAGSYYVSVQSTNATKGGSAYYNVRMTDDSVFYTAGDNSDDWTDLKTGGEKGQVGNVGVISAKSSVILEDWVGFGDAVDNKHFTLESAARLSFAVSATDAAVFSVCQLVETMKNNDIVYSLQTLDTVTLTKEKGTATTAPLLLEAGDYYFSMTSSNAADGGSADYSVSLNAGASTFFVDGNNSDDWTDVRTEGPDGYVGDVGVIGQTTTLVLSDWVGYGDEIDYKLFTIDSAAKLSFTVTATDAAVFTLYRLNEYEERGEAVFALSELQTVSLATPKTGQTVVTTKPILLGAGDYYFSMKGVNAATGGSASYTVSVNTADSVFFVDGDNLDDWTNLKTEGADGAVGDAGTIDAETTLVFDSWVGYGDAVDYAGFTLESAAKLSFTVTATDSVKFTVYQLVESWKNEEPVYSLQSLQTVTVSVAAGAAQQTAATTPLVLDEGVYYFSVESINAASGKGGYYTVNVNTPSSVFFVDGDNSDDWTDLQTEGPEGEVAEIGTVDQDSTLLMDNWVGYGDAVDYAGFTIDYAAKVRFSLTVTDSLTFTIYRLVESVADDESVVFSLDAIQTTTVTKPAGAAEYSVSTGFLLLESGDYYIGVESTNAADGGSAYYTLTFDSENSVFYVDGDNSDDWTDLSENGASGEVAYIGSLDQASTVLTEDWVGFGDAVDYAGFSIKNDAGLCFTITATDAAEFTIYRLVATPTAENLMIYSLEALQTTVLTKAADALNYSASTQLLQLAAGDYYFGVRSVNAADGASAYYTVSLNAAACTNLPEPEIIEYKPSPSVDDGWNNWLYDAKTNMLNTKADSFLLTPVTSATAGVLLDDNPIDLEGWSNYVGYGDETDFAKIRLSSDARLSFNITATDAAEFTIYHLAVDGDGYSLKIYQSTVLAKNELDGSYAATTQALLLAPGDYYISMTSLTASTGGGAYYNVAVNQAGTEFLDVVPSPQEASAPAGAGPLDSALDDSLFQQTSSALA